jgi:hypothetical protein
MAWVDAAGVVVAPAESVAHFSSAVAPESGSAHMLPMKVLVLHPDPDGLLWGVDAESGHVAGWPLVAGGPRRPMQPLEARPVFGFDLGGALYLYSANATRGGGDVPPGVAFQAPDNAWYARRPECSYTDEAVIPLEGAYRGKPPTSEAASLAQRIGRAQVLPLATACTKATMKPGDFKGPLRLSVLP